MQKLLLTFARRPWLWLALLTVASLLAASQLGRIEVRISADEMLVSDDPHRAYHEQVEARFGAEQVALLVVEDPALEDPARLQQLADVVAALEALPFVARTDSLFNTPDVRSVDGYLDKSPFLVDLTGTADDLGARLQRARDNPLLRDVLISADADAMAIAIVLNASASGDDTAVTDALERSIAPLRDHFAEAYTIGFAQVRSELSERILAEQAALLPLAVAALLAALFLLLRQLLDIVTPLLTAGISILWTFGLMGWLGIPLNVVTSTVPILLIVVGSTEDIHLLAEFRHAQRRGEGTAIALRHMARKLGRTVLLTFATTYAGFLSVGLSGIEVLSQFGLVASTGLLFNFIVTIVLIPAVLALTGHWQLDGRTRLFDQRLLDAASRYWAFLQRRRGYAFLVLGVVAVMAADGIPRIQVSHSPVDSLGPESPTAQHIAELNAGFAGLESFSVVIESGIQDTFLHTRYLNEIIETQAFIQALDPAASATSFADYLTLLNEAFLEDDTAGPPQSNEEIAELMIFLDGDRVRPYVTEDFSRTRILVRHQIDDNARLRETMDRIREFLDRNLDPGLSATVTGDSMLALSATDSMIRGQLQSVLLILALFVVIVSLLFTDVRVGLLAALPNLFPIVILFGVMGHAGIPLNIGTTMTAAIAIGIAVDDTLHFMLRYNQELRSSRSQAQAMRNTLFEEALPVVTTSFALSVGFLVFALSDFVPVAQFGLLSALVIVTALIADFVITPLVISSLRLVTLWDLLSSRVRRHLIPSSPLFRGMRPWQIRRFVLSSTLVSYRPGDYIYRQGDASQALFLVMTGLVEITVPRRDPGRSDPVVDRFASGQLFGDVALLAEEPRKTDAVAVSDTTLMVLGRDAIQEVTRMHPFIASKLFFNLARDVSCRWVNFITRVRSPAAPGSRDDGSR